MILSLYNLYNLPYIQKRYEFTNSYCAWYIYCNEHMNTQRNRLLAQTNYWEAVGVNKFPLWRVVLEREKPNF